MGSRWGQGSARQRAKTAKELALRVMAAKGLDTGDKVLAHAMAQRMIHALRQQWRRGQLIEDGGTLKASRVWALKSREIR